MQNAKFFRGEYLTVRPGKTAKPVVIVSKKISNKAVVRNKLRRQIKELLRHKGLDSVIVKVARQPADNSFQAFKKDLANV